MFQSICENCVCIRIAKRRVRRIFRKYIIIWKLSMWSEEICSSLYCIYCVRSSDGSTSTNWAIKCVHMSRVCIRLSLRSSKTVSNTMHNAKVQSMYMVLISNLMETFLRCTSAQERGDNVVLAKLRLTQFFEWSGQRDAGEYFQMLCHSRQNTRMAAVLLFEGSHLFYSKPLLLRGVKSPPPIFHHHSINSISFLNNRYNNLNIKQFSVIEIIALITQMLILLTPFSLRPYQHCQYTIQSTMAWALTYFFSAQNPLPSHSYSSECSRENE